MPRSVRVEGDELVVRLSGWKAAAALKRELRIPRSRRTAMSSSCSVRIILTRS
jgi:hypothetical protein